MSQMSRRKFEKRKARERELRRKKTGPTPKRRASLTAYPEWLLRLEGVSPRFAELVRDAVSRIDFDDRAYFSDEDRQLLRQAAGDGFAGWLSNLAVSGKTPLSAILAAQFPTKLGSILFSKMPQGDLEEFLFDHDLQVLPEATKLCVTGSRLPRVSRSGGTVYHSPHRPTVKIGGVEKVVGFTRHAIERCFERLVPAWRTYAGHGDAFAYIHDGVYFEPCELQPGQPGFTMYEECVAGFWSRMYAEKILGPASIDPTLRYVYRLGYCPVVIESDFAIAKSLLFPGFRGTPEYRLLVNTRESRARREELRQKASELSAWQLQRTMDFDVLRWFQQNGVPQVVSVPADLELFRHVRAAPATAGDAGATEDETEFWVFVERINGITSYVDVKPDGRVGPLIFFTPQSAEVYRKFMASWQVASLRQKFKSSELRKKSATQLREISERYGLGWQTAWMAKADATGVQFAGVAMGDLHSLRQPPPELLG